MYPTREKIQWSGSAPNAGIRMVSTRLLQSLEQLASTVAERSVLVSDTAVHNRFNESCGRFLHAVLQELTQVVVQADQDVPLKLLRRRSQVIIEVSHSVGLPDERAEIWQGCGGHVGQGLAAVKIHVAQGDSSEARSGGQV